MKKMKEIAIATGFGYLRMPISALKRSEFNYNYRLYVIDPSYFSWTLCNTYELECEVLFNLENTRWDI